MFVPYFAIAALLGAAVFLIAHWRFDWRIRHLLPVAVDNAVSRKLVVQKYRKLDRLRIAMGCGVIACWAICAGLWTTSQFSMSWNSAEQNAFKAIACAIFLITLFMVERHNYHRDCR